jgi:hypothetical protein
VHFSLNAIIDDDTRKQIRKALLEEVKGITRAILDETVTIELKRLVESLQERYVKNDWLLKGLVKEVIGDIVKGHSFGDLQLSIAEAVEAAAQKNINQKLANKTVWEASKQETYIREIVVQELRKRLAV